MDAVLFHLKGDVIVGSDARKVLGDVEHLDDECHR